MAKNACCLVNVCSCLCCCAVKSALVALAVQSVRVCLVFGVRLASIASGNRLDTPRSHCRRTSVMAMLWLLVALGTISPVAGASIFTSRVALLDARDAWCADPVAAAVTYGHIADWEVSQITDMSYLFCSSSFYYSRGCKSACANFNGNLSGWDTSKVTSMRVSKRRVAAALHCHEITARGVARSQRLRYASLVASRGALTAVHAAHVCSGVVRMCHGCHADARGCSPARVASTSR